MKQNKHALRSVVTGIRTAVGILAVVITFAAVSNAATSSAVDRSRLEKMAETAKGPKEHVAVAKQYKLQAEQFEKKARDHEAAARKLEAAPRSPMAHKWPAMSGQPWVRERQLAMEARRAASECLEASERHLRFGVESLAEAADTRSAQSGSVD